MQQAFSTHGRPRFRVIAKTEKIVLPLLRAVPAARPSNPIASPSTERPCTMLVTVDSSLTESVRGVVSAACGASLHVMRTQANPISRRTKIFLQISASSVQAAMSAIMRALPAAEFGRIVTA